MDGYSVDGTPSGHIFSVRLVRVLASAVEHITCDAFSSPSECGLSSTSALIDSVAHASCDACHSMLITPVGVYWSCRAFEFSRLSFGSVVPESCDALLHAVEVALSCI